MDPLDKARVITAGAAAAGFVTGFWTTALVVQELFGGFTRRDVPRAVLAVGLALLLAAGNGRLLPASLLAQLPPNMLAVVVPATPGALACNGFAISSLICFAVLLLSPNAPTPAPASEFSFGAPAAETKLGTPTHVGAAPVKEAADDVPRWRAGPLDGTAPELEEPPAAVEKPKRGRRSVQGPVDAAPASPGVSPVRPRRSSRAAGASPKGRRSVSATPVVAELTSPTRPRRAAAKKMA